MNEHSNGHRRRLALGMLAVSLAVVDPSLCAAIELLAEPANPTGTGFQLPKEEDSFNTSLEDFNRYRDKKQWDAAFRVLATLSETPRKGFAPTEDGFLVPSAERVRDTLLTLPADGREAYRLFNDAQAKKLFEESTQERSSRSPGSGTWDDIAPLKKIVADLFLTTYGDRAADRLGDALFEAGQFGAAAEQWRVVLSRYPDSQIPPLRLQVKRAIALARAGRSDALAEVVKTVEGRFTGETIEIGGKSQDAVAFVRSLSATASTTKPSDSVSAAVVTSLEPASETELWQTVFLDDAAAQLSRNRLNSMGWGSMVDPIGAALPPAVADDKRIYVNWIGITFAIDLTTGKLAWWSTPFGEVAKRAQQITEQGNLDGDRFSIALIGKWLYSVGTLPAMNNSLQPNHVVCYDPATGKEKWSSANTWSEYSVLGQPVLVGDALVMPVAKQGQANLELIAADPDGGKKRWTLSLGTGQLQQSFRGNGQVPPVSLHFVGGTLYALTNSGALLAINADTRQVEWALRTETTVQSQGEERFFMSRYRSPSLDPPGKLLVDDATGVMYVKESKSSKLYAIDAAARKLLWRRPLATDETVAALHAGRLITAGADVGAIDPASRRLNWSTRLPVERNIGQPLFGDKQMLMCVSRGLYLISTETGDVLKIIRGADAGAIGGTAFVAGDKLIVVSNRAITAYPLAKPDIAKDKQP